MQLTPHFSLAELTNSDTARRMKNKNTPTTAHYENLRITAANMEKVRTLLGDRPIRITSGYRNPAVNKAVGGVPNSDHALGWAIDFQCPAFGDPFEISKALAASRLQYDQLIHEYKAGAWWVHISFNPRMRRQNLSYDGRKYYPGILPVHKR